jgi:ABC-type nitrate/sulfonate/bicarbonate transport system permease component
VLDHDTLDVADVSTSEPAVLVDKQSPRRRPARRVLLAVIGAVALLVVWQLIAAVGRFDPVVLPGPILVIGSLFGLFASSEFWTDLGTSLGEFLLGFVIGEILGIAVGTIVHASVIIRRLTAPIIETFRFIVPFAWIPLVVLWFGTSLTGKTWLVAYAVFFVTVVSTADALRNVDDSVVRAATTLGMSRPRRAITVELRAAAPLIANAATAAAGLGWIAVVAAEYVGSSSGLGFLIINASSTLQTSVVLAGMVVIGLVGAGMSAIIRVVSHHTIDYSPRT